jgi:hypothetical protein
MSDAEPLNDMPRTTERKKALVRVAEILLILAIIGLLIAIWMPGFFGARGPVR